MDQTREDGLPRCTTRHPVLGQCLGIQGSGHPHYGMRNRKFEDHPMTGHRQDRGCLCGRAEE